MTLHVMSSVSLRLPFQDDINNNNKTAKETSWPAAASAGLALSFPPPCNAEWLFIDLASRDVTYSCHMSLGKTQEAAYHLHVFFVAFPGAPER